MRLLDAVLENDNLTISVPRKYGYAEYQHDEERGDVTISGLRFRRLGGYRGKGKANILQADDTLANYDAFLKEEKDMKYHFFIPGSDPVEVIHWVNTIQEFKTIVLHKREVEKYACFSEAEDVRCRVLNPTTMQADDYYLSELMELNKLDI